MTRTTGYSVIEYGDMITCEPRMGVYAEALRRAVTPGCTVIDLGAGFGVFSLLACQYGAGRVIAIEPHPNVELVMPLAKANGFADRITVVRELSTRYTPETRADVLVSDCRGTMPLFEHHIDTITDARTRLLAPGGTLMPMRDTLRIALANAPKLYQACETPWRKNNYGLDLQAARPFATSSEAKAYLTPRALLSEAQILAVIDYRTVTERNLDASVELEATRGGIVHGLLVWFDAEIAEGLGYSNAPGQPRLVYGQMLLPLAEPVRLAAGDRISARIRGNLIDGRYLWSWDSSVIDRATGAVRQTFRQSSFLKQPISRTEVKTGSSLAIPQPSQKMQLDIDCLAMVNGELDQDGIAKALLERYPQLLPDYRSALDHVTQLLRRYPEN
jgi:protein arginine N-methyltransferase 1